MAGELRARLLGALSAAARLEAPSWPLALPTPRTRVPVRRRGAPLAAAPPLTSARPPPHTAPHIRSTTLAVAGADYCIVAASMRMSTGYSIMTRRSSKILTL